MSKVLSAFRTSSTVILDSNPFNRRLLYFFSGTAVFLAVQIMHLALADLKLNAALTTGLICGYIFSFNLGTRWRPAATYGVSILSMIISVIYFLKIQATTSLYGNYIGILAGILIVLLAFKAFSPRDHRFMLMFSMVFLLYSSVASFDLKYMVLMPIFLLFAGMALYVANQIEIAIRVQESSSSYSSKNRFHRYKLPTISFSFDATFLWVLIRAVLGVVVLASVAYILIPHSGMKQRGTVLANSPRVGNSANETVRETNSATSITEHNETSEIGLSEDFDLTDGKRLSVNPRPMLKVRSHRSGYLRAKVYDTFTGTGWEKSRNLTLDISLNGLIEQQGLFQGSMEDPSSYHVKLIDFPGPDIHKEFLQRNGTSVVPGNIQSRNAVELNFEILRQEVTLIEDQPAIFFAFYQPFLLENVSLNLNGKMHHELTLNKSAIVQAQDDAARHPKGFSYTVFSMQPRVMPGDLQGIINNPPEPIRDQYTQLPIADEPARGEMNGISVTKENYRPISSSMRNFALTRFASTSEPGDNPGVATTLGVVQSIYNFLTDPEEFTYKRGFDYADSDLELTEAFCMPSTGTQEGYCRQFASAMAVLCRINGIPARIVTGYAPGSFGFAENAYIYKASDAHAWVEVYFDGYGWVMFDPSPASADALNQNEARLWIESSLDFLQELFVIDPASTRETILLAMASMWEILKEHTKTIVLWGVFTLVLLAFGWWTVLYQRRRRTLNFVAENQVIQSYLDICSSLRELGFHQQLSQTARAFLEQVCKDYPELEDNLCELIPVYESAAYSSIEVSDSMLEIVSNSAQVVAKFVAESKQTRKRN